MEDTNKIDKYKQVIVMRRKFQHANGTEFGMRLGKIVAQACHASNGAAFLARGDRRKIKILSGPGSYVNMLMNSISMAEEEWYFEKFTKVVLQVDTEEELLDIRNQAVAAKLPHFLVCDEGVTEFNGNPTHTCIAIGPARSSQIDAITGGLKLL